MTDSHAYAVDLLGRLQNNPPEQRRRAATAVIQRAEGRTEALELLDMLGLGPDDLQAAP